MSEDEIMAKHGWERTDINSVYGSSGIGKEPQVTAQVIQLTQAIAKQAEIIGLLTDRLVHVLAEHAPKDEPERKKHNLVPLAADIADAQLFLNQNTSRLNDIIERLEV